MLSEDEKTSSDDEEFLLNVYKDLYYEQNPEKSASEFNLPKLSLAEYRELIVNKILEEKNTQQITPEREFLLHKILTKEPTKYSERL